MIGRMEAAFHHTVCRRFNDPVYSDKQVLFLICSADLPQIIEYRHQFLDTKSRIRCRIEIACHIIKKSVCMLHAAYVIKCQNNSVINIFIFVKRTVSATINSYHGRQPVNRIFCLNDSLFIRESSIAGAAFLQNLCRKRVIYPFLRIF